MKIYSQAYAHAPVLSDHLAQAKLNLINEPGDKLHRVIARAAARNQAKFINLVKGRLGLKASTPLPIKALNDLYYEHVAPLRRATTSIVQDPFAAARLFADSRLSDAAAVPKNNSLPRKKSSDMLAKKTVRFATLPPPYKAEPSAGL